MEKQPQIEAWHALRESDPGAAALVLEELRKNVFVPHEGGQAEVMESLARFRVLRAGRRWGKTQLAAHEVINAAVSKPNQMVWWVANTDKNVRRGYRAVKKQVPRMLLEKDPPSDGANDRILLFKNGSSIEFYTAGTPGALAGEGVDFVVIDEAALIPEDVWFQLIRPTLSDTGGRALLISTPRGRNWFYRLWMKGQSSNGLYESWHFKTSDSPYIPDEEVEDARDSLPAILFDQEYLAEFVATAASMFTLEGETPGGQAWTAVRPGLVAPYGWVTIGVDLAKKQDFTVISGVNTESGEPCIYERFNEVSWPVQERHIQGIVEDLHDDPAVEGVTIAVDSTGVGDVVFDHLEEMGLDVVPINFASGNVKERMVRLLASDLEHGRAFIIEEMRGEFETYEYEITPNGRYKFEAPEGMHDDKVAAKLLEHWAVVNEAPPGVRAFDPAELQEDELAAYEEDEEVAVDTGEAEVQVAVPDSARDIMQRTMPRAGSRF